jgi:hypothetical protein
MSEEIECSRHLRGVRLTRAICHALYHGPAYGSQTVRNTLRRLGWHTGGKAMHQGSHFTDKGRDASDEFKAIVAGIRHGRKHGDALSAVAGAVGEDFVTRRIWDHLMDEAPLAPYVALGARLRSLSEALSTTGGDPEERTLDVRGVGLDMDERLPGNVLTCRSALAQALGLEGVRGREHNRYRGRARDLALFEKVTAATAQVVKAAYDAGRADGSDMLARLADGSFSVRDFNKATLSKSDT